MTVEVKSDREMESVNGTRIPSRMVGDFHESWSTSLRERQLEMGELEARTAFIAEERGQAMPRQAIGTSQPAREMSWEERRTARGECMRRQKRKELASVGDRKRDPRGTSATRSKREYDSGGIGWMGLR